MVQVGHQCQRLGLRFEGVANLDVELADRQKVEESRSQRETVEGEDC